MQLKDVLKVVTSEVKIFNEDLELLAVGQEYKTVCHYLERYVSEICISSSDDKLDIVVVGHES